MTVGAAHQATAPTGIIALSGRRRTALAGWRAATGGSTFGSAALLGRSTLLAALGRTLERVDTGTGKVLDLLQKLDELLHVDSPFKRSGRGRVRIGSPCPCGSRVLAVAHVAGGLDRQAGVQLGAGVRRGVPLGPRLERDRTGERVVARLDGELGTGRCDL